MKSLYERICKTTKEIIHLLRQINKQSTENRYWCIFGAQSIQVYTEKIYFDWEKKIR